MLHVMTSVPSCTDEAGAMLPGSVQRLTHAGGEEGAGEAVYWQAG